MSEKKTATKKPVKHGKDEMIDEFYEVWKKMKEKNPRRKPKF